MDSSAACRELKEPGVIDESMIYNAIIEQGPKFEEGRLFKEQGIDYKEVNHLRLEFLDILKIDHLWMMTGLTKLQLCNNIIEDIENLDMLTELKELDLSFNNIGKIKNLETLKKLEILTLFENKIQELENMDHLTNLTIFSIGNNRISDFKSVLYLRAFDCLKSLNMAGNPICEEENFVSHVIAYLPQLVYYEYKMIKEGQKREARACYLSDLTKLERDEAEIREIINAKRKAKEQDEISKKAFVDGFDGEQLFLTMFENDSEGKTLLHIGENIVEIYKEYKKNFCDITKEIHSLGLEQAELRRVEMEEFKRTVDQATEKAYDESRKTIEAFMKEKNTLFSHLKTILDTNEEDDEILSEYAVQIQAHNESFQETAFRTWNNLMKRELYFLESSEEVNGTYERRMTEMVNQFIEIAQTLFTQLRQLQGLYNENVTDAANKFFTLYTVTTSGGAVTMEKTSQHKDLLHMMQDREILINALASSHDLHMLVIDQSEDKLISGVRGWLSKMVESIVSSQIQRNRKTVTELNHFLNLQKAELDELSSMALGIFSFPKEV